MFLLYIIADCHVYICDFHREQAWERWAAKKDNGVLMEKETLLCHLRRAARAETIPKYNEAVDALKSLTLWKENPKLRNWLNNIWLKICKVMCLVKIFNIKRNGFLVHFKNLQEFQTIFPYQPC